MYLKCSYSLFEAGMSSFIYFVQGNLMIMIVSSLLGLNDKAEWMHPTQCIPFLVYVWSWGLSVDGMCNFIYIIFITKLIFVLHVFLIKISYRYIDAI